jgi:hypothetical protein
MGQEHSLPNGDRERCKGCGTALGADDSLSTGVCAPCRLARETPEEYTARLMHQVSEARRVLGAPLHSPKPCKSCGAKIFWAQTTEGRSMPVNAECVEGGNIQLYDRNGTIVAKVYGVAPPGTMLRKAHFATCPQADQWRKDQ